MSTPIDIIARAMSADLQRLDAVSQNVANSSTPGYRAQRSEPAFAGMLVAAPTPSNSAASNMVRVAVEDGPLRPTGRSLDVAVTGDAWFTVQTAEGMRYTRNGAFALDASGTLVDSSGHPVLGDQGPLTLMSAEVRITADGSIYDGANELGRLKLAALSDSGAIAPAAGGLVSYTGTPDEAARFHVKQGFLETSNVQVVDEMTRLIEIQRHIESVQRAISAYDQILNSGINDLGSR